MSKLSEYMTRYCKLLFALLSAASITGALQAQESGGAKATTGECVLLEGERVAADGSCGNWTARQKIAVAKKSNIGTTTAKTQASPKNQLRVTSIVDFQQISRAPHFSSPVKMIYVCVKSPQYAHKSDLLVLSVTDSKNDPEKFCVNEGLTDQYCTAKASASDSARCKVAEANGGWLPDGTHLWCVRRAAEPSCRYLPIRAGQKLSAWITHLKPPSYYSVNKSAAGTWHIMK